MAAATEEKAPATEEKAPVTKEKAPARKKNLKVLLKCKYGDNMPGETISMPIKDAESLLKMNLVARV